MADAKGGVTTISCVLALALSAGVAAAQDTQGTVARTAATDTSEKMPAGTLKISYAGGQLRIDAVDLTMWDVLTKVAALTGVKFEIPAGASSERLPVVKLGPGPARQILASLLTGSSFDYLIQASAADPEGIQNVILMPREKKGSGGNATDAAARPSRSPYARASVSTSRSEETPEPNSPGPAQPDNLAAETSASTPAPTQPDQPTQPGLSTASQSVLSPATLSNRSGLTSEGALSPPSSLDSQSINQQLQQMYQQRSQMIQQDHQSVPPPASAKP